MKHMVLSKLALSIAVLALVAGSPMSGAAVQSVDLVIHYVEGVPVQDQNAYDVSAYLSVVDENGDPIEELEVEDFLVTEDAKAMMVASLDSLEAGAPIHVGMVIDASHSMTGDKITTARKEASRLIADQGDGALAGLVTFGDEAVMASDFTPNHADVLAEIANIEVEEGAGSCLYDGIYEAVKMTALLPPGRRAVIVLTDGEDEKRNSDDPCSAHTSDDIINLASSAGTLTPIFTIGLGTRVDEDDLKRISAMTGGLFSNPETYEELDEAFSQLSDQLNMQYVLHYVSTASAGAHTLAVKLTYKEDDDADELQDNDTRQFLLPVMPVFVKIAAPPEGQVVRERVTIEAVIVSGGDEVSRVDFIVNDAVAGSSASAPYLYELDLAPYPEGILSISVIAYGGDGAELASAATTITVEVLTLYEKVLAGDLQAVRQVSIWAGIGGGVVAILLIILGISMARRRRKARAQAQVWDSTDTLAFGIPGTHPAPAGGVPNPAARGILVVEKSDDADMIGQRFEIANEVTNLGRSADNDVMFPKDTPVSRRHAQITARADGLYLGEVETIDEGGQARRPTYGTFVNGKKLEQAPVLLMNGDAIKLGDRTVLRFEASQPPTPADEKTYLGPVSEDMETRLIAKKK